MQAHGARLRPLPRCSGRPAPRRHQRQRPTARRADGALVLLRMLLLGLLIAVPPASRSAMVASAGEAPTAGGDGPALDSTPIPGAPRQRAVFVCQQDGVPVFADRPCSSASGQRTLPVEVPAQGAAPGTAPSLPRASTRPRLQPESQAGAGGVPDTRCVTLRRQLDELDARMRSGYGSREAARLWNRWRELKGRLRAERC